MKYLKYLCTLAILGGLILIVEFNHEHESEIIEAFVCSVFTAPNANFVDGWTLDDEEKILEAAHEIWRK